jgi:hypothetical protein
MTDLKCPHCFAPLPEGKRHSCVPLRRRVHPTDAFIYNDNGEPRSVRLHESSGLPKNAPPNWAIDRYPRAWELSQPLGPICAGIKAAGLPQDFGREAATVAIDFEDVGDPMRMWADAADDTERMKAVLATEELIGDIQIAYPKV